MDATSTQVEERDVAVQNTDATSDSSKLCAPAEDVVMRLCYTGSGSGLVQGSVTGNRTSRLLGSLCLGQGVGGFMVSFRLAVLLRAFVWLKVSTG